MAGILNEIGTTLEMIKWEHSIFALPFALTAMLLAAGGLPGWRTVAWIVVAMVAARSAAMAFNRWADADLDAENPRTRNRAIPAGLLSRQFVLGFTCVAAAVFLVAAAELNRLTLELAPVALAVLLGYSYLKRVTQWSHLGLGLALGLAPTAAWIAVRGSLDPAHPGADRGGDAVGRGVRRAVCLPGLRARPRCRAAQPAAGDRGLRLLSGRRAGCTWPCWRCWCGSGGSSILDWPAGWALAPWGCCWRYEHSIVSPRDLRRLNAAFFTMNGVIAMVFLGFVSADVWMRR